MRKARSIDTACGGRLKKLLARGDFAGRAGETLLLADLTGINASHVLLTGLGPRKQLQRKGWRKALGARAGRARRARASPVAPSRSSAPMPGSSMTTTSAARSPSSPARRSIASTISRPARKPPPPALQKVLAGPVRKAQPAGRGLAHGAAVATAMSVQRDLANLPANVCTPIYLAEQARALAKRHTGLNVRVLDEAGDPPREDGLPARGGAGQPSAAALHRARVPGDQEGARRRSCSSARASPSTAAASRSRTRRAWTR